MQEMVSLHAESMVRNLLSVHALSSMARGSGSKEYMRAAARWLPTLEMNMDALRRELSQYTGSGLEE